MRFKIEKEKSANEEKINKYRKKTVIMISLFIIIYFLIFIVSISFTMLCFYIAIKIIVESKYDGVILLIASWIVLLGGYIFIFVKKFIFSIRMENYQEKFYELKEEEEIELFEIIKKTASDVNVDLPTKVYLYSGVGAAVFYKNTLKEVFKPHTKNLLLGIGLLNILTKEEFEAVLLHEFAHFSQNSSRLLMLINKINKGIIETLYNNVEYNRIEKTFSDSFIFFIVPIIISKIIIYIIKHVLKISYYLININYFALSREQEYNADNIAASIIGDSTLKKALLKTEISNFALQRVMGFYEINPHIKSLNVYRDQKVAIKFYSKIYKIDISDNYEKVNVKDLEKLSTSCLIFQEKWSSHPYIEERINRLNKKRIFQNNKTSISTNCLIKHLKNYHDYFTEELLRSREESRIVTLFSAIQYGKVLNDDYKKSRFSDLYNGYYYNKNPKISIFNVEDDALENDSSNELNELFSDEKIEIIRKINIFGRDIDILAQLLDTGKLKIGIKYNNSYYKGRKIKKLKAILEEEQKKLLELIRNNDRNIYIFFKNIELKKINISKLSDMYKKLFLLDNEKTVITEVYEKNYEAMNYLEKNKLIAKIENGYYQYSISTNTKEIAERKLKELKVLHKEFQKVVKSILIRNKKSNILPDNAEKKFLNYCKENLADLEWKKYLEIENFLNESFNNALMAINIEKERCIEELLIYETSLLL
ncbi:M48 family metalloprotease [Fusobacterium sp. PH5-44]|uniref:M48 family metalloprotease n=1 Tax=unclassified Fusobacterium TaxID=2648384 RepID=UPI003D23010B